MSNVYKYFVAREQPDQTRYIDTNAITEERLKFHEEQALRKKAEAERIAREKAIEAGELEEGEGEFVPGLSAEMIDPVTGEAAGESMIGREEETEEEPEIPESFQAMAEEFLGDAQRQADELLASAKEEAERLRREAVQSGRAEGYEKGKRQAEEELAAGRAELDELREALQTEHEEAIKELEPQLLAVILQVFERVFGIQFGDKKEILTYLVTNTILNVEGAKGFRIRASEEDAGFLSEHLPMISEKVGQDYSLEVIPDASLSKGQCMIETDSGIFDCGIDTELSGLIKDLQSLAT